MPMPMSVQRMYLEYYGLKEPPFSITPDPRFVFLSERHRDALAHLLFGIDQGGGGGFVQLTGEVGTGKTTLCRLLLERLPEKTRVALVLNPRLSPVELLETICEELRLDLDGRRGSLKRLVDLLNEYLLEAYAQGLHVVLIIDEAQNLSSEALEQVRLLTNLETPTQKLLQILLLGQPELRAMLAREDLRQLAQRITARFHLTPLDTAETLAYLRHRYRVAGGSRFPFTVPAVRRLHKHSGGVPRLINVIAERALLAGYAHDQAQLDERWVDRAALETLPSSPRRSRARIAAVALAVAVALSAVAGGAALWWRTPAPAVSQPARTAPVSAPAVAASAPAAAPASPVPAPMLDGDALAARVRAAAASPLPAMQQLLSLWGLPATRGDAATAAGCPPTLYPGVHCMHARAQLDRLVLQGRPVLLRLRDGEHEAWAVLLGSDALAVRLWLDGEAIDVSRLALQRVWDGAHLAVWRGPGWVDAAGSPVFTADARGPAIDWVRDRLQPRYLPPADGAAPLDAAMAEAVRRFQRDHGLASDGVIGPETLMALAALEPSGPRLRRELE
jgi:general secretion pathway protein A